MTSPAPDLDALERLAKTATTQEVHPANWDYWVKLVLMVGPARAYIAAASPDVILALLQEVRAARAALARIEALKEYVEHSVRCISVRESSASCSCGLAALLRPQR